MESQVLLVTEDPALTAAVAGAFAPRGWKAIACEPARSVFTAASLLPSLVLLDLETRTLPWRKSLLGLLVEPRTRTLPVIALTRNPALDRIDPVIAGAHDILGIPLGAEDLERIFSLLLTLQFRFATGGSTPGSANADRLLLYAERHKLTGRLSRTSGDAVFTDGTLTSCRFGAAMGRPALAALLAAEGDLRFERGDELLLEEPQELQIDLSGLLDMQPLGEPPPAVSKPKVLSVDDDENLVELIAAFLRKEGFEVETAPDGEEGYQAALRLRPEAIVSDLEMPVLDGWGLLRKVRADHRLADTPLVFLSAAESFRMSIQASAAGAQDYLSKSGARELLAKRLRGVLAPRRELELAIGAQRPARSRVELVGARWALLRFAALAPQGTIMLADGLGLYEVGFENGELRSADAKVRDTLLSGMRALEAFIAVRAGDLAIGHALRRPPNLSGGVATVVEGAADRNNAAESLAVTRALAARDGVRIDRDLCAIYVQYGPAQGRPIAEGLLRGMSPIDLIVGSGKSPVEVESVLRDLARRGVIAVPK